ncbi:MAG: DUF1460 domain-containing protein [Prevotella sp.]|nr:DUF1460 domain-containing protein [Prevotella sp.]
MRSIFLLFIALWPILPIDAIGRKDNVSYLSADSMTICKLLDEARHQARTVNISLFLARKFLGVPYMAHTLEINKNEKLVVNTRQLDCTTFVETVTALTLCVYHRSYTWQDYLDALKSVRYRDGQIENYTSRIHYFTEWITVNTKAGIVKEVQNPDPPFSAVQAVNVNFMSRHPESYKALRQHPEYVSAIRQMEKQITGGRFRYIPKQSLKNTALMRNVVVDGDIIAITSNKKGLDIAHLGFAVWKNGELHLLNASQLHKKVIEEPMTLYQYLQKHPSHTGIRIIRIRK